MKAVRFVGAGCPAQVVDIPTPIPGPGEILVKIGGAGACHSDLHVLKHGRRGAPPQFTLGHENAGWIAELGSGTHGWKQGDAVAVYPLWDAATVRPVPSQPRTIVSVFGQRCRVSSAALVGMAGWQNT